MTTKLQSKKKQNLKIYLTHLTYREIKRGLYGVDKIPHIDIPKVVVENFESEGDLSDVQSWILNQIVVKKIESIKASKISEVYVTLKEINRGSAKSFREVLKEFKISQVDISILKL